jgi:hypothetical protein
MLCYLYLVNNEILYLPNQRFDFIANHVGKTEYLRGSAPMRYIMDYDTAKPTEYLRGYVSPYKIDDDSEKLTEYLRHYVPPYKIDYDLEKPTKRLRSYVPPYKIDYDLEKPIESLGSKSEVSYEISSDVLIHTDYLHSYNSLNNSLNTK